MDPKALLKSEVTFTGPKVIVCWSIRDIKPKALVKSGVILASLGVNNYCLLLSIILIFLSTDGMSYWGIKRSNLELRIIYGFDVKYIFLYLQRLFSSQIKSCLSITRLAKRWFI